MILVAFAFAFIAFILGTNLLDYFWQAGVTAGIVFVATLLAWYFELTALLVTVFVLLFLAMIVVLIIRKFR